MSFNSNPYNKPPTPAWARYVDDEYNHCRSCGSKVWWCVTKNGKKMPLNQDGTSHFSTCPEAKDWRR